MPNHHANANHQNTHKKNESIKNIQRLNLSKWVTVVSVALLCVGIIFMLIAPHFNDIYQMWLKASNICLECIGIG